MQFIKAMPNQQSQACLYWRVKYLTNIGEHAEANALLNELLARKVEHVNKHHESGKM